MKALRLFFVFLPLVVILLCPSPGQAQQPVLFAGQVNDGGVTRTVTLTVVFTPVQISTSEPVYTTTLTTGNTFFLQRSISYGDIIAGAGGLILLLTFVFFMVAEATGL
jgi:hypothetical protein